MTIESLKSNLKSFEQTHRRTIPYLYALASTLLLTTSNFFVKELKELPTGEIQFYRSIQHILYAYTFVKAQGMDVVFDKPSLTKLLLFRGFISFLTNTLHYIGISLIPLSDSTVIMQTNPAMVGLLAPLLLGETFDRTPLLTAGLCTVGIILMAEPSFIFGDTGHTHQGSKTSGIMSMLGAAFALSISQILVKKIGKRANLGVFTFYTGVITGMISPIMIIFQGQDVLSFREAVLLLLIGVFTFIGDLFKNRAYVLGTVSKVTVINYVGVIYSFLLDIYVMGNPIEWLDIIGSLFVCSSLIIFLFKSYKPQEPEKTLKRLPSHHDPQVMSFGQT